MDYEKFTSAEDINQQLLDKLILLRSLIDESKVDQDTRTKFLEVLDILDDWTTKYNHLEDAIYGTVGQLLAIYKKDSNQEEAKALFENTRDDLWSLVRN
jgi:hypothetical protein